jgi:tetratricopeptide (TPR) repeat protein
MPILKCRLSLKGLMACVAVLAVVLGWQVARQRARQFRLRAAGYARIEQSYATEAAALLRLASEEDRHAAWVKRQIADLEEFRAQRDQLRLPPRFADGPSDTIDHVGESWEQFAETYFAGARDMRSQAARVNAWAAHYARLREKYENAAARPWLVPAPDPAPPEPHVRAARFAAKQQYVRAVRELLAALRADPKDVSACGALARLLATCPDAKVRDGYMAIKVALAACELGHWSDAQNVDTLAAAYAEAGDFSRAIDFQTKALAILATSPDSHTGETG